MIRSLFIWRWLAAGLALASCSSSMPTAGGGGGASGAGGTGGAPDAGRTVGASGLPTPPGAGGLPKPSGTPGNLTILNWAGFTAAVSWTFDDSQPSQIAHYAELAAVGIPVTFYISTGNSAEAGYDATWTQAVNDGNEIGNHTVHHCQANLTGCSFGTADSTLTQELDDCTGYITQHYPQSSVWTSASPFGDTGYDLDDATRFLVNRGVGNGLIGANDNTDMFNLPIYLAQPGDTASIFSAQIDGAHSAGKWLILLVHSITPTTDLWYNPVAITDVTGGMSHGQSLGDVWNDTVVAVAAYWRAQKLVSGLTPTTSGTGQTWTWTLPANFPSGKYLRATVAGGTLSQGGNALPWNDHGYYELALDAGSVTLSP
ncbi:MAG TPA: polysaccharide deacetylase family protein [Polyangia bacterium]|nr:polysaccharide deacetylase family protein [Polyangia bacterium]